MRAPVLALCVATLTASATTGCSTPTVVEDDASTGRDAETRDGGGDASEARDGGGDTGTGRDAGPCPDEDGDGHAAATCGGDDCDDTDGTRHPGATERCDVGGVDEDCDPTTVGMRDADGDGYDDHACCNGTTCGDDCDDAAIGVHPDAPEVCNSRDDDCDAAIDEGVQITFYGDCDGDGVGAGTAMLLCTPSVCGGHPAVTSSSDCDDTRPEVRPGASETCNDRDDDCNGTVDDGTASAACPAITNGTAACVVGTCGVGSCATGYHACSTTCVADTSVNGCGTSCTPCASPDPGSHAHATCDGTSCGVACDTGYSSMGAVCDVPVPRPVAPMSTSTVTTQRPTFRWQLPTGADGARVELCADRACTLALGVVDAIGTSASPSTDLPHGVVFWRLRGMNRGVYGEATSPVWQISVPARSTSVDSAWGTTPDVNGDGFSDLLIGAQPGGADADGRVYVHHGSASGVGATPTATIAAPARGGFGVSVASAGDVNGDGFGDVIVGARDAGGVGAAYVFLGGASGLASTPATTLTGPAAGTSFGLTVAGLGDTNRDGYGDVAVAAPDFVGAGSTRGRVFVYFGSATGTRTSVATTISAPSSETSFGQSLQTAGDVNGDGYADLVVGGAMLGGRVHLGGPAGIAATPATTFLLTRRFGYPGDVNGDGYTDVLGNASALGGGDVYYGSPTGVGTTAGATLMGCTAASGAGDVDGDGYDDIVTPRAPHLFRGSSTGPTTSTVAFGSTTRVTATTLGDVNGDGFTDVVLTDPTTQTVEVFHGASGTQPSAPARALTSPVGPGEGFGASVVRARCVRAGPADARRTPWCASSDTAG